MRLRLKVEGKDGRFGKMEPFQMRVRAWHSNPHTHSLPVSKAASDTHKTGASGGRKAGAWKRTEAGKKEEDESHARVDQTKRKKRSWECVKRYLVIQAAVRDGRGLLVQVGDGV